MNISVIYYKGKDMISNLFPSHSLNEVQENIKKWTKRILFGPNKIL